MIMCRYNTILLYDKLLEHEKHKKKITIKRVNC